MKTNITNYSIDLLHWVDGSGFSHAETIENLDHAPTAEEMAALSEAYACADGDHLRAYAYDEDNDKLTMIADYYCDGNGGATPCEWID